VCSRVHLPIVAIGGVTRANVAGIARAGAAGVAAISLFDDAESLPSTIEFLRRTFDT
jgi:thiamine monophosphate synthase